MGDAFNPYSHWLKLPPQRWKPTYYELLGIDRSANDKDVIIVIGKKLYAEVKAAPLAGHEKEHKALLAEIEEAVRTFASNTRRKAYDEHLSPLVGDANANTELLSSVPTALTTPKVPSATVAAQRAAEAAGANATSAPKSTFVMPPMAAPALAAASPTLPASIQSAQIAVRAASAPVGAPIARPLSSNSKGTTGPAISIRTEGSPKSLASASADRHRQQQARQHSMLIALSLGGIVLVGVLGFLFRDEIRKAIASAPTENVENTQPTKTLATPPINPGNAKPSPETAPPAGNGEKTDPNVAPEKEPEKTPAPEPETKPETKPEVKPEMEIKPEMKPEATPPAPIVFSATDAAKLKTHCEAIVAALKSRNASAAATELESAQALAKPPEAKASVDRLALIVGPFRAFWSALDESWTSLKAGDEVSVGASTKVKVATISPSEIEIETASGKRKQTRESLSIGLLLGLVRAKLDLSTPDGKLALAMFHLVDKSGNAQEGAKLLSDATTSGLSVDSVKSTLESPFDFASLVTTAQPSVAQPSESPQPTDPPMTGEADELVKKLRAALTSRDIDTAAKLGAEIEKLSKVSGASPKLAAEAQLAIFTNRFWDFVAKGIESFKGTEEIMVNDEVILVIEAAKNKLVCRIRGKRNEYNLKNIPPALALAIVEMKIDKTSADFELCRGALYFTQKEPRLAQVKEAWESAKAKGAPVADLLLTLSP